LAERPSESVNYTVNSWKGFRDENPRYITESRSYGTFFGEAADGIPKAVGTQNEAFLSGRPSAVRRH
jgi:hypothetical protein